GWTHSALRLATASPNVSVWPRSRSCEDAPGVIESRPMTTLEATKSPGPVPQAVNAILTRAAIFLVVTIKPGPDPCASARSLCADLAALVRAVGFRDSEAALSCVVGFGSEAWDRLFGSRARRIRLPFGGVAAAR